MSVALMNASNSVAEFLVQLMLIDSTTGKEGFLAESIAAFFTQRGWHSTLQPISSNSSRFNVLITRSKSSTPRLLFNTHLDTVPPYIAPKVTASEIKGRGSNDAKAQIAVMTFVLEHLAKSEPKIADQCGLLLVVGEETDHIGMEEANSINLTPEYLIVGEPTELLFARAQKGALKLRLNAKGKAAHSGYPDRGKSAIHLLLDTLTVIRNENWPSDPSLGETTLNVGLISGGQALNALAAEASASLMFRVVTETAPILNRVKEIAESNGIDVELLGMNEPVLLTEPPSPYQSTVVAFNTDIPYFKNRNQLKGTYLFGAGSITNAHSADEYVPIDELQKATDILIDLAKRLLLE